MSYTMKSNLCLDRRRSVCGCRLAGQWEVHQRSPVASFQRHLAACLGSDLDEAKMVWEEGLRKFPSHHGQFGQFIYWAKEYFML